MKLIDFILDLLKKIFSKKTTNECDSCSDRDACAHPIDKSKKYAVIVGLDNSRWGSCPGANLDSNNMLGMVSQFVDSNHIVKLNDGKATKFAVVKALQDQIAKTPEDGIFVFTYSGHGGQMNASSTAKNEIDGKDEFLCLYDNYLIDNDLWDIFNKCKGKVFVVFDCCHSSTMFSLNGENKETEEDWKISETPFFKKFEGVRAPLKMFVISGCGEETVSWGDARNGGCLTSSLKRAFNKCLTYSEWWNKARNDSSFKSVKQVPIATRIGSFDLNAKIFN